MMWLVRLFRKSRKQWYLLDIDDFYLNFKPFGNLQLIKYKNAMKQGANNSIIRSLDSTLIKDINSSLINAIGIQEITLSVDSSSTSDNANYILHLDTSTTCVLVLNEIKNNGSSVNPQENIFVYLKGVIDGNQRFILQKDVIIRANGPVVIRINARGITIKIQYYIEK